MSATKAATISTIARRSLRAAASPKPLSRCISSASCVRDAALEERPSEASNPPLDSSLASKPANRKPGTRPPLVGSARRRAALRHASGVPFEQLPYQAFQEARKILIEDRQQKLEQILEERKRIAKLQRQDPAAVGGEKVKEHRLREMQQHLEKLKILADINDPVIKKRYEDGEGMTTQILWIS
jgi:large subunit ribosomal protein L35